MSGNSIAISRELVAAGVEQKTASAVAEALVKYSYSNESGIENRLHNLEVQFVEHRAETKAEFKAVRAEIKAEAKKNDTRFHILSALIVATFAGVYAPMLQNLFGG